MREIKGRMDASGKRFVVIVSRWNELVTSALLSGALDELARHGEPEVEVIHVPGAWEIPAAASAAIEKKPPSAILALGCILQGETPHAGNLAAEVGSALMRMQVEKHLPIAWGILTPDSVEQALDRAGLKHGNKGREAALAAIEMADLLGRL
ncbi:MAG: 6,7-dimethyl-8-ribityllumazine synthase [Fimbriimonas ginsengisoli]|uniref:6,7-dimethyl-8-ribityllumazine synthase n=1 Tax=Fimbriimonas ginsengisoli TaxID=1005039 RepID=A0A931LSW4_FIMGI|nr:6,7-dimethyl-8-ribityllumazine synthase [Fimbriimonas ginsengisoli]